MTAEHTKTNIPILMYHSISDGDNPRFKHFTVSPSRFAAQMRFLAERGYTPVTVSALAASRTGRASLPVRPVALTFDDGFRDFYEQAYPVLREHGFAATLYVVSGCMGGTSRWLEPEGEAERPMLSWEQLAEVGAGGVECGGHTRTHPKLDSLRAERAREEIAGCRADIQARLSSDVLSFSYPFGYFNSVVKRLVRDSGYTSACAVNYAISSTSEDPLALSRLIVTPDMSLGDFASLLTGRNLPASILFQRVRSQVWKVVRPYANQARRKLVERTAVR